MLCCVADGSIIFSLRLGLFTSTLQFDGVSLSSYLLNVGAGYANTVANITTSQKPATPM